MYCQRAGLQDGMTIAVSPSLPLVSPSLAADINVSTCLFCLYFLRISAAAGDPSPSIWPRNIRPAASRGYPTAIRSGSLYCSRRRPAGSRMSVFSQVSHLYAVSNEERSFKPIITYLCTDCIVWLAGDINSFDLPEGERASFDRVISIEMFEHMKNYGLLMNKISRWLKPGGKVRQTQMQSISTTHYIGMHAWSISMQAVHGLSVFL